MRPPMPDPDRLLITLRRATQAFRDTPGRYGRVIHLDAVEVLAAGDLHGNLENFRRLLNLANLPQHPGRHLVLQEVIHGDFCYPEGGDKSHQLLDLVAALKAQHPRQVHLLLGNHELAQTTNRIVAKEAANLNELFRQGVEMAYGSRAEEIYAHYMRMLLEVPLAIRTANRIYLSHSLPPASRLDAFNPAVLERDRAEDADLVPGGSVHSLLWGRDASPANVDAFLRKVDADLLITGHIPCDAGFSVPNEQQLILDSLGHPAACCLFPTDRPLSHAELVACVKVL
jgi:Calcineurin-like phosphoesterase